MMSFTGDNCDPLRQTENMRCLLFLYCLEIVKIICMATVNVFNQKRSGRQMNPQQSVDIIQPVGLNHDSAEYLLEQMKGIKVKWSQNLME